MPDAFELLPPEGTDDARRVARVLNGTRGGKLNCTGSVALPDEGGLVGVSDVRAWEGSVVLAMQPWWLDGVTVADALITFSCVPGVSRLLRYVVIG
jgi:hypothetical protein